MSGEARAWWLAEQLVARLSLAAESAPSWGDSSGCRAGALGQEVLNCLERLLCSCEAFSEALYCKTKQPVGETGESRKGTISTSFISVRFNHRWCSSTTKLAMRCHLGGAQG